MLRPDGEPAALVEVQLRRDRSNSLPPWEVVARAATDRAGNYRINRVSHFVSDVRVVVESGCGSGTSDPFLLSQPGERAKVPELRLGPPTTVEGVVRDQDGKPLPGARVWLRDWDLAAGRQISGSMVEVFTDREGRYRFTGVPPGGAWLQLLVREETTSRGVVEPFEVVPGKTLRFDLRAPKE